MTQFAEQAAEIVFKAAPGFKPKIGIVCGSGLGVIVKKIKNPITIPYSKLPGFLDKSIEGQGAQLYLGELEGTPVACLQARPHIYQGATASQILTPIRMLKRIGCETVFLTNAAGSLRPEVTPGHLVVIKDHLNFQFNIPLIGPNDDQFGPRFVGMQDAYDPQLREALFHVAKKVKIPLVEGVYIATLGPIFETPAEIKAFKMLGADVVGMSTVPEVIAARHCGLRVIVVSAVTNLAAGLLPHHQLSHEETLEGAAQASSALITLASAFIAHYPKI